MFFLLPALLASAPLQAVPASPDKPVSALQDEVWALTRRVGSRDAYRAYLQRFPDGTYRDQALVRTGGAQSSSPPSVPPPPPPPKAEECRAMLTGQVPGPLPADGVAFRAARRLRRMSDWQAFIRDYPTSVCRWTAERIVRDRGERLPTVPGWGPLPPQRLKGAQISPDDYPPASLRAGTQGRVTVEWDVAEDGVGEGCRVVQSVDEELGAATCRVAMRFAYDPARDARGAVTRGVDRTSITWVLPQDAF